MSAPSISVIIPAYNAAPCLHAAIASALAQSLPPLEILVVDDGSTDDTAGVAAACAAPVRCLRRPNGGLPAARNTGIQAARGAWLALLDADDTWEPEHLARQMESASAHGADVVFSDARVVSPARVWESWLERSGHHWLLRSGGAVLDRPYALLVRHGSFALPSSVLVRAAAVATAGGFDEAMRPGPEDLDLWLRLAPKTRWAFNRHSRIRRSEGDGNLSADGLGMAAGAERLWCKAIKTASADLEAELRGVLRARLAQARWEQAYWGLQRGQLALARRAAWRSFKARPAWRPALYGMAATLPPRWLRALQRLKKPGAVLA